MIFHLRFKQIKMAYPKWWILIFMNWFIPKTTRQKWKLQKRYIAERDGYFNFTAQEKSVQGATKEVFTSKIIIRSYPVNKEKITH